MQNERRGLNYEKAILMTVRLYHALAAKLVGTNVISRARFQFPVHRVITYPISGLSPYFNIL